MSIYSKATPDELLQAYSLASWLLDGTNPDCPVDVDSGYAILRDLASVGYQPALDRLGRPAG